MFSSHLVLSQCDPTTFQKQTIYSDSTIVASLIIEDADIDDLSNPAQGVCGVNLFFSHDDVRDIIVRLISPDGQSVDLVGPIAPTASQTINSTWDIEFLPSSETAIPDPSFSSRFTNTDPWFSFGFNTYIGSYYPNVGDLEGFNTGPVNGLWSIEIINRSPFYPGELLSFELRFCNDNFVCQQCVADPGSFDVVNFPSEYCVGDEALLFDFSDVRLPLTDYNHEFYILQEDEILNIEVNPDLRSYEPGEYLICGLSYFDRQSDDLPDDIFSYKSLDSLFKSADSPLCAKFTEDCFRVNILSYQDTIMIDTTICVGSSFDLNGQSFTTSEVHSAKLGNGSCDTLVLIDLTTVELNAIISNTSDLLTCTNDTILLSVGSSTFTPNTIITWETDDGNILGNINGTSVQVTQQGQYRLVLEEGACSSSSFVDIDADAGLPMLDIVIPDTLTCSTRAVELTVNSDPSAISYDWTGPDVFTDNDETIEVFMPGTYSVKVTLPTGCSSTISQEVYSNTTEPDLELDISGISCDKNYGEVQILNTTPYIFYDFPGGTLNNATQMIEYPSAREYTVLATSQLNGCTTDSTFTITSNIQIPSLSFDPVDDLDCGNLSVDLIVNTDILISSYAWVGPDGPLPETNSNLKVTEAGTYEVTVIAENGCMNSLSQAVVAVDTDLPTIDLSADIITCSARSVRINSEVNRSGLTYRWFNDAGFSSTEEDPMVSEGGKYYLEASVSASCIILDSVTVEENLVPPNLNTDATPITCINSESQLTITDQELEVTYSWFDPAGNALVGLEPLVNDAGLYTIQAIGSNGCETIEMQEVIVETLPPVAMASAPTPLLCDTRQVNLSGEGSSEGINIQYAWSTTDGSIIARANTIEPLVGSAGTYELLVTNADSGCESNSMVVLEEATNDLSDLTFEKFDPPCSMTATGSITAGQVVGGVAPYTYSIDGFNYQESPLFDKLPAAGYKLSVKDRFGCGFSKNVILQDGLDISVDLEDSYEINLGDELEVLSTINTNGDQLRSIDWSISDQAIASGQERVNVRPLADAVVEVNISTESGCEAKTSALIKVTKERDIYAPNTFDPTSFGDNAQFKVFATNAIKEVRSINIYDRWGNEVFNAGSYDPKVETKAWDGTHSAQNLIPGVYVYLVEVLLIDGEQRKISGEVLLIR